MELIRANEVAKILGLKPRYVAEKLVHKPDFPVAYRILGGSRKWAPGSKYSCGLQSFSRAYPVIDKNYLH